VITLLCTPGVSLLFHLKEMFSLRDSQAEPFPSEPKLKSALCLEDNFQDFPLLETPVLSCAAMPACLVSVTSRTFIPAGVVMLHTTIDLATTTIVGNFFFFYLQLTDTVTVTKLLEDRA